MFARVHDHGRPGNTGRGGAGRTASAAHDLRTLIIMLTTVAVIAGCAPSAARADNTSRQAPRTVAAVIPASQLKQTGLASWYGPGFAGRLTANGEVFDPSQLTAAHKELPFNTLVRVTNERNQMSVVVRINDRGPFKPGRIVDLSRAGAEAIDMIGSGVAEVTLEVLTLPEGVVRVEASGGLRGFEVISRFHPVGTLLVLAPMVGGAPLVVRVVSQTLPIESPADILVGYELYASVGSQAR
ncbi:MAG: septal ring lytic transglycosylase RlpA family protein, partial [Trueperaceae bacterium]